MMENQTGELRPILKNVRIIPKRCPQCKSFFIEDQKCEDCGHDLSIRKILTPDDDKSFYNMMDDYFYEKRRFLFLGFFLFPEKYFSPYQKLQKRMVWRLQNILEFLETAYRLTKKERFLLVQEARDIIAEKSSDKSFKPFLDSLQKRFKGAKTSDCFESIRMISTKEFKARKMILLLTLIVLIVLGVRSNLLDGLILSDIFLGR